MKTPRLGLGLSKKRRPTGAGPGPGPGDLLAALTAAAGTAPTALWIPGEETFSDDSGTPAGDGDRIYQINDLTGNGYHMREGAANKGPILRASGSNGIGDKPALEFLHTNQEFMDCVLLRSAGTVPMYDVAGTPREGTHLGLVEIYAHGTNNSTLRTNPGIFAGGPNDGSGTDDNPSCNLLSRDNETVRLLAMRGGTVASTLPAADAPFDVPKVLGNSVHWVEDDQTASRVPVFADKTSASDGGTNHPFRPGVPERWGRGYHTINNYLSGRYSVCATWSVSLEGAALFAVVDVLRAYAGLDPVADPE
jgi:hypothetical protein